MSIDDRLAVETLSTLVKWNIKTLKQAINECGAPVVHTDVERLRSIVDDLNELTYEVMLSAELSHNAQLL